MYNNAVDIWSLGCVIYKIATQSEPFPSPRDVKKFCEGRKPFPEQHLLEKMSADGVKFVKRLIVPNPGERLSAESALEIAWLSQRKRDAMQKTEQLAEHSIQTQAQISPDLEKLEAAATTDNDTNLAEDISASQPSGPRRSSGFSQSQSSPRTPPIVGLSLIQLSTRGNTSSLILRVWFFLSHRSPIKGPKLKKASLVPWPRQSNF